MIILHNLKCYVSLSEIRLKEHVVVHTSVFSIIIIQVFVETLDKCFENVCELDLIFHMDKVSFVVIDYFIENHQTFDHVLYYKHGNKFPSGYK